MYFLNYSKGVKRNHYQLQQESNLIIASMLGSAAREYHSVDVFCRPGADALISTLTSAFVVCDVADETDTFLNR